jgi:putative flippase GtrA
MSPSGRIVVSNMARFGVVAAGGLALDLGTAWLLARQAGVPLPAAAATGFVLGAVVNNLLHELWTFGAGRVSGARGAKYVAVLALIFAARVGMAALLAEWLSAGPALIGAVGVSFAVNFLLSRKLVFSAATRA